MRAREPYLILMSDTKIPRGIPKGYNPFQLSETANNAILAECSGFRHNAITWLNEYDFRAMIVMSKDIRNRKNT